MLGCNLDVEVRTIANEYRDNIATSVPPVVKLVLRPLWLQRLVLLGCPPRRSEKILLRPLVTGYDLSESSPDIRPITNNLS